MDWLCAALQASPQLKLIMVQRADPADGIGTLALLVTSINEHLAPGGVDISSQVTYAARTDRTVIHSKTWIIDDEFVITGSANCSRRSLYTDAELSVGVLDEDPSDYHFAISLRRALWGEHCGKTDPAATIVLTDLNDAIRIWNPDWTVGGDPLPAGLPVLTLDTAHYQVKKVPFEAGPAADQWPQLPAPVSAVDYDQQDADSRLEY
jgi:phosphatidylserine/phosphatidylglycerophosphate/cardiolipin synthase-like enzyme